MRELAWRRAKRGSGRVHYARYQDGGWAQALCGASGRNWLTVPTPAKGSKCLSCIRKVAVMNKAMEKLC